MTEEPSTPWFRPPPGVDKGTPRIRTRITAGLLVSNDEGRRWFNEKYGIKLDHHRQDLNVPLRLDDIVREAGIAIGCCFAPRRLDPNASDFLVITQVHSGHWVNDGPDNYEEVLMDDVKPVATAHEEGVKRRLESELGKNLATFLGIYSIGSPTGIKTCGFKSYFK